MMGTAGGVDLLRHTVIGLLLVCGILGCVPCLLVGSRWCVWAADVTVLLLSCQWQAARVRQESLRIPQEEVFAGGACLHGCMAAGCLMRCGPRGGGRCRGRAQ